ncbi:MAG: hypothetical protein HXX14_17290 [Bacteroidetes bacterium]|nr:hypothetical protein [Bacteroidota bacterium]
MRRLILVLAMLLPFIGWAQSLNPMHPSFDQMMGVNITYKAPLGRLGVAGTIREFHVWSWNQPQPDVEDWNPQSHIDFERFYANLTALGHLTVPVIQMTPSWMFRPLMNEQSVPIDPDALKATPEGFKTQSHFIKRFAEVYGYSGIQYIENWNEPDKDWSGQLATFRSDEFAAMCSADYNRLQQLKGNLSSQRPDGFKLVMGGLAYPSIPYLNDILQWSRQNRSGGVVPFDVINLHHYSNSAAEHQKPIKGISPEEDHLREKMNRFVQFRNEQMPDKQIWVSEFGYDTWAGSTQGIPTVAGQSIEETQGQWIVRSFLELSAAGIDRAILFALSDSGDPKVRYNTSGLLKDSAGITVPKRSWYYVSALRNVMQDMYFQGDVKTGDPDLRIYHFADASKQNDLYALWYATSRGKKGSFTFNIKGQPTVRVVSLANGFPMGVVTDYPVTENGVSLNVSERPVFMVSTTKSFVQRHLKRMILTPDMIEGPDEARAMIDEQNQGDPFMGNFIEHKSASGWTNNVTYPVNAFISFHGRIALKAIYLKDTYNVGKVKIYYWDERGTWKQIIEDPMCRYFVWDPYIFKTPLSTDRLKVILDGKTKTETSCLGEIMVYTEE